MKNNKLTLSELRNVIKEEVQFQLTKKNLVESLDSKTLKRILKEGVGTSVKTTKTIVPNFPFTIINPNANDTIKLIATKNFTSNKLQFEFDFTLGATENQAEIAKQTFLKLDFIKNVFQFTNDKLTIFDYTKIPVIKTPNGDIPINMMKLVVYYPEGLKLEEVFNLNEFKGQKLS
jgi:hypothetical protein